MASVYRRAALAVVVAMATAGVTQAQRRPRTLSAPTRANLSFSALVAGHIDHRLGGPDVLAAADGAEPLQPSVYVTVTPNRILVWDEDVLALASGGIPGRRDLARCAPHALCLPRLRDAAAWALGDELDRVRRTDAHGAPRALVIADARAPFRTFLAVAYAIAHATGGSPPALALAVRTRSTETGLGQIDFAVTPADSIQLSQAANPLLLQVRVEADHYVVRAEKEWLPGPLVAGSLAAVVELLGQLKARDTHRLAMFVDAAPDLPLARVVELWAATRFLYPRITFGRPPNLLR